MWIIRLNQESIFTHTDALTLCKLSSDWLVKQVPWSLSVLSSAITGLTHNKWCKVNPVRAGLWCLCPSSCTETLAAGHTACNSYILTVRSLQVFTGVCHGCSRASWYEGWEPSAEFNNVSHFCSDWLAMCKKKKRQHKQPWSCVPLQFISQAKSDRLSCGKERSVTSACPGLLTLPGSGSTLTNTELEQPGSVLHPPNQPQGRTQTWLPCVLTNCP